MTTDTAKAKPAAPGSKLLSVILYAAGVTALVGFLITSTLGIFGVFVPFLGVWVAVLTLLGSVKLLTAEVADVWHKSRVKADVDLIAASMAAQDMLKSEQEKGLSAFLSRMANEGDKNTTSGGYL